MDPSTDYPTDRSYSREHEWLKSADGGCYLGITLFARDELGDVVYVELPEKGQRFEAGAEIGTIESVKAVAELFTPVAGEIVAINEKVVDAPELVNEDPHGEGWLVCMAADLDSASDLLTAAEYLEFLASD